MLTVFSKMDPEQRMKSCAVSKEWNYWLTSPKLEPTSLTVKLACSGNLRHLKKNPSVGGVRVVGLNDVWLFEARGRSIYEFWNEMVTNLDIYVTDSNVDSLHLDCTREESQPLFIEANEMKGRTAERSGLDGVDCIRRVVVSGHIPQVCMMERRIVCSVVDIFRNADEVFFDCNNVLPVTWEDFLKTSIRSRKRYRRLSLPNLGNIDVTSQLCEVIRVSGDKLVELSVSGQQVDVNAVVKSVLESSPNMETLTFRGRACPKEPRDIVNELCRRRCAVNFQF